MTHSPEPWKIHDDTDILDAEDCMVLGGDCSDYRAPDFEDLERIIACVNACQGIRTQTLESGAFYLKPALLMGDYETILRHIHSKSRGGYAQCVLHPKEWDILVKNHAPDLPPDAQLRIDGITVRPQQHPGDWM